MSFSGHRDRDRPGEHILIKEHVNEVIKNRGDSPNSSCEMLPVKSKLEHDNS